ncbi:hypothetical protein DFP72DRAFT_1078894 [Ephemerocybe angulata]|uniref:Uncharacterized protein n=1 Tax=Ephemerocybe angulata TaxID=980116 RepID=A0A8H6LWX1_9AGAR|nr:hypothetical protein DFP72DRAFT_1078894 [Tulosesus angulatus]
MVSFTEMHFNSQVELKRVNPRLPAQDVKSAPNGEAPPPTRVIPANMFKRSTTAAATRVAADTFSLPNDVEIPVYDAREVVDLDFHRVLPRLAESLPPFAGEVPLGSFIVVGYTSTVYRAGSGNMTLGCNILWAIVVGTPEV